MSERFTLAPFARSRTTEVARPPSGGSTSLRLELTATITGDGQPTGGQQLFTTELKGPGDVIGIAADMIRRTDPDNRLNSFEANYFPLIEFDEPDFPWRYSLDTSEAGGRVQPWLSLIALKDDEYDELSQNGAPLPAIRVRDAAASLPDLADAVYTAHVHLSQTEADQADIDDALTGGAARAFSRVLCMRKLDEATAYTMFLVPNYKLGQQAGLGQDLSAAPHSAPAWTGADSEVSLPVYLAKRFVTNSGEDVEMLLRRLRAIKAEEQDEIGAAKRVFSGEPGRYDTYQNANADFVRQAATMQPDTAAPAFDTDPALVDLMSETLDEEIAGNAIDDAGAEDPLVAFPAYGWRFRFETGVNKAHAEQYWFDRLNLDPRYREAAGTGTRVVKRNQDRYMTLAWAQYEEVVEANRQLARLQTARELTTGITRRRFAKLPDTVALALSEPLQPLVPESGGTLTLQQALVSKGVPRAYASRAMRKLAAKRSEPEPAAGVKGRTLPVPELPGDSTSTRAAATATANLRTRATTLDEPPPQLRTQLKQLAGGDIFAEKRLLSGTVLVEQYSSAALVQPLATLLPELAKAKAVHTIAGLSAKEAKQVAPVWRSPDLPVSLAHDLQLLDREALLAGTDKLPDNSVAFLVENRAFIEAFMVGANHEMNAELRWRGFPTDMRGTVLRRFWSRGLRPGDPAANDIDPIHRWANQLGLNPSSADADQAANLVVVIRGEIIRKLGLAPIELNIATGTEWLPDSGTTFRPNFFGKIGSDVAFYGFDVSRDTVVSAQNRDRAFLALYEPTGQMRFGLDVATKTVRNARIDPAKVASRFPVPGLARDLSYKHIMQHSPPIQASAAMQGWDDFSWSHVGLVPSGYIDLGSSVQPAHGPNHWGSGKTSASIARSTWQKPIVAILPLRRVL